MKILTILLCACMLFVAASGPKGSDQDQSAAIKAAAMDYVEGWYQADGERMQRSLHPDLVKRVVRLHPKTKAPILNHISKTTLVEYTNGGGGKDTPKDKLFYDVKILDVYNGIATVKAVSANYVDNLHLAKWDGKWMIVNILWDNRQN